MNNQLLKDFTEQNKRDSTTAYNQGVFWGLIGGIVLGFFLTIAFIWVLVTFFNLH